MGKKKDPTEIKTGYVLTQYDAEAIKRAIKALEQYLEQIGEPTIEQEELVDRRMEAVDAMFDLQDIAECVEQQIGKQKFADEQNWDDAKRPMIAKPGGR